MRVYRGEYGAAPECNGGEDIDPREKTANEPHRPARSPRATIRGRLRRKSNPVRLGGSKMYMMDCISYNTREDAMTGTNSVRLLIGRHFANIVYSVGIGKFREFKDLYARSNNPLYIRASDACSLAAAPLVQHFPRSEENGVQPWVGAYAIRPYYINLERVFLKYRDNDMVQQYRRRTVVYVLHIEILAMPSVLNWQYEKAQLRRPTLQLKTRLGLRWGRGGLMVRLLAPYQGDPGLIPGGSAPGFIAFGNRISRFPHRCIPALLHTRLASPSSALKTSTLRAAQISSLTHSDCVNVTSLDIGIESEHVPAHGGVLRKMDDSTCSGVFRARHQEISFALVGGQRANRSATAALIKKRRWSGRGDRDMRINSLIASTRKALNWRAVLPSVTRLYRLSAETLPFYDVKKRRSDTGDTNTHAQCLIAPTRKACNVSHTGVFRSDGDWETIDGRRSVVLPSDDAVGTHTLSSRATRRELFDLETRRPGSGSVDIDPRPNQVRLRPARRRHPDVFSARSTRSSGVVAGAGGFVGSQDKQQAYKYQRRHSSQSSGTLIFLYFFLPSANVPMTKTKQKLLCLRVGGTVDRFPTTCAIFQLEQMAAQRKCKRCSGIRPHITDMYVHGDLSALSCQRYPCCVRPVAVLLVNGFVELDQEGERTWSQNFLDVSPRRKGSFDRHQ
ncbi:hypothetical protein PR048_018481 [Dryococelus australis]|uniref:Uncharacterized protein n=1 Tax=Dryococelus australis TaxID=614101 RepID=A0ABQ9HD48_9NEOP|nr:hypothetical protein PR048_018481 [Dryococelus australis]